jgi:chemotaxis signal transduction protein
MNREKISKKWFLLFFIGKEVYCNKVKHMMKIIVRQEITKAPDILDWIIGVINLRGQSCR